MKKEKPKMYLIRKYVKATSVAQAIRKEKTTAVHEVYLDNNWSEKHLPDAIGFEVDMPVQDEEEIWEE